MISEPDVSIIEDIYELSPMQQGMLFHSVYEDNSGAYIVQFSWMIEGDLDVIRFQQAWQQVIARHSILRTSFHWEEIDKPVQVVRQDVVLPCEWLDWRHLDSDEQHQAFEACLQADRETGFHLEQAPLMRLILAQVDDQSYRLIWSFHHILLDAWCITLILPELLFFYEALGGSETPQLDPAPPYSTYIAWLQAQQIDKAEAFWRERLRGFTTATSPNIRRMPTLLTKEKEYGRLQVKLSVESTLALQAFGRQHQLTLNTLVQGVWALLLGRYSGEGDVLFGSAVAGRPAQLPGVQQMVGLFINTLPVRVRVSPSQQLVTWLKTIQVEQLTARRYEYAPLASIQKWSEMPAGTMLFDTLLTFGSFTKTDLSDQDDLSIRISELQARGQTHFPLSVNVEPGATLALHAMYDQQHYSTGVVQHILTHICQVLEEFVRNPNQRIGEISITPPDEYELVVRRWNATETNFPDETIVQLIERQAACAPEAIAVSDSHDERSYQQLNEQANQLAWYLRQCGVGPDIPVGVALERSCDLLVALLAVWKTGGAYVPLESSLPTERLQYILDDACPLVVITKYQQRALLPDTYGQGYFCLDAPEAQVELGQAPLSNPIVPLTAAHLAYIIYTSGSTGKPKGVMVHHGGLTNYLCWAVDAYAVEYGDGAPVHTPLGFDLTISSLFLPLVAGRRVVLLPDEQGIEALANELHQSGGYSLLKLTPSHLEALNHLSSNAQVFGRAQSLVLGGEALYAESLTPWRTIAPNTYLFNEYGPTETVVGCMTYEVDTDVTGSVPIGRPIANTQIYVLDGWMRPVPIGVRGELYIGGVQVTRGYLNRPELTAERFVPDPFSDKWGARLYRTGDVVRWQADGQMEYLGRNDDQVKLRGHRIELGEIEAILHSHAVVRDVTVVLHETSSHRKQLVAYVVLPDSATFDQTAIHTFLQMRLPEYMLPTAYVVLSELPLTSNGKVDRRALPDPEVHYDEAYVAPRNAVERTLVAIWEEVLGIAQIGIHENYFGLGGDSILSLRVVALAKQQGLRFAPKHIFEHPTIAKLAQVVDMLPFVQAEQHRIIGEAPCTPIQARFFEQCLHNPHHYNQAHLIELPPPVDRTALAKALQLVLTHHDALRTRFSTDGQRWWQYYIDEVNIPVTYVDMAELPVHECKVVVEHHAAVLQEGLDILHGPIIGVALFDHGMARPGQLLIVVHHLVIDIMSWNIVIEDLQTAYHAYNRGETSSLPAKTTSYKQWAERLASYVSDIRPELSYWLAEPRHIVAALPVDKTDGANTIAVKRHVSASLEVETTRALLGEVNQAYHTEINDILLTALIRAFQRWTKTSHLVVDLESHGREDPFADTDLSRTVGWFTVIYPMLLDLGSYQDLGAAICAVKEQLREAPNRGIGYGLLRYHYDEGGSAEQLRALPPAEVNFNYCGQKNSSLYMDGDHQFNCFDSATTQDVANLRRYVFEVNCMVADDRLQIDWLYSDHLHQEETVVQLLEWFLDELRLLVAHCLIPSIGRHTPSDFPLVDIDQQVLDRITRRDRSIDDLYPLTSVQHGILFHALYDTENQAYLQQFSCVLGGDLDIVAFQRSWQHCIDRHAILRTSFQWEDLEYPLQVVHQRAELCWEIVDWRGLPTDQYHASLDAYLEEDCRKGFDFRQAPLMRMALLQIADDAFYFVWTSHHILLDGWSRMAVMQEVFTSYESHVQGIIPDLPTSPPFCDYIAWLQQQKPDEATSFWRQELGNISAPTPLGVDHQQVGDQVGYTSQQIIIPEQTTMQLQKTTQQHGLTLNTIMQGAWAILLSTYSGESDVLFGTTVAGRPADLSGVETMIGMFINTLPLRVRLDPALPVDVWLHQVQQSNAAMRQYEYCSLVDIQGWSNIPRQSPLFESLLTFENYPMDDMLHLDNVRSHEANVHEWQVDQPHAEGYTNYPLTITAMPGRTLQLTCTYDRQRFDADTITRMLDHFKKILAHFTVTLTEPLGQIEVLTAEEREQILYEWNATATCIPEKTIIQLIEQQVTRTPEAIAVSDVQEERSYTELNQQATQLAWLLRRYGVGPDVPVGVALGRSCDLLMVLLAVWKAGGAYVPLDTSLPMERLQYILEDVQPSVVVTTSHLRDYMPLGTAMALCIDMPQVQTELAQAPLNLPTVSVGAAHLAYIIYTSGSTGKPKGVMVPHEGLTNYMWWAIETYAVNQGEGTPMHARLGFDFTDSTLFLPLLVGRCVEMLPEEQGIEALATMLRESGGYGLLNLTPSHLEIVNHLLPDEAMAGRACSMVLCGEPVYAESVMRWRSQASETRLFNGYGPTEATIICTWYEIEGEMSRHIPIGKPVANTQVYVLDGQMRPVPMGVMGELYIGGVQVARGYLNRPELTAERFVPDPFGLQAGGRLYRTGDVVRWRADGQLEYLGRNDHQVKLRGHRVELGEIEMTLLDHPGIRDVTVSLREDVPGDKRLVAYIVADEAHLDDQTILTQELRAYCEQLLPNYMHPSAFVLLSTLPLTPNGKVDRHALPVPEMDQSSVSSKHVLPRNSIEFRLVQIWERILRVQPIGITDNFFELGGHSLLVIQLVSALNTEFNCDLPLSTIFQSPTIGSLATLIHEEPMANSSSPLVAIQPQGTRPPFFCVHPGSGEVLCYIDFAQELGKDQPFYGLEDLSYDGRRAPYAGVEVMAADYVQAIQDIQPHGPYLLGGWSFGGIVALEMAHQLMQQGEEVALLALLDSGAPQVVRAHHTTFDDTAFLAIVVSDLTNDLNLDLLTVYRELREYPSEEQPDIAAKLLRRSSAIFTNVDVDWMRQRLVVAKGRVTLLQSYKPQLYAGPVTLLRASVGGDDAALLSAEVQQGRSPIDTNHLELNPETRGWEKIVDGPIDVQFVPGTHAQMITPPYVQTLARVLRERIDNAVKAESNSVYSNS